MSKKNPNWGDDPPSPEIINVSDDEEEDPLEQFLQRFGDPSNLAPSLLGSELLDNEIINVEEVNDDLPSLEDDLQFIRNEIAAESPSESLYDEVSYDRLLVEYSINATGIFSSQSVEHRNGQPSFQVASHSELQRDPDARIRNSENIPARDEEDENVSNVECNTEALNGSRQSEISSVDSTVQDQLLSSALYERLLIEHSINGIGPFSSPLVSKNQQPAMVINGESSQVTVPSTDLETPPVAQYTPHVMPSNTENICGVDEEEEDDINCENIRGLDDEEEEDDINCENISGLDDEEEEDVNTENISGVGEEEDRNSENTSRVDDEEDINSENTSRVDDEEDINSENISSADQQALATELSGNRPQTSNRAQTSNRTQTFNNLKRSAIELDILDGNDQEVVHNLAKKRRMGDSDEC